MRAAAQQADALHEPARTQERYRQARSGFADRPSGDARGLMAGAGVAWTGGPTRDEAAALPERELELSSAAERAGLLLPCSELLRVQRQLSDAPHGVSGDSARGARRSKTTAKPA